MVISSITAPHSIPGIPGGRVAWPRRLVQDTSALVAVAFDGLDDLLELIRDVLRSKARPGEPRIQRGTSENIDICFIG